ncbi:MAG: peptidoglycan-binding domain-containing protein [Bacillota bacterium]|nr:peptidoglycan-binding domain-containing protein [Bacillota bacterium]
MKNNRVLLMAAAAYTALLIFVAVFYILKGSPNYLNYKSYLASITKEEKSTNVGSGSAVTGKSQTTQEAGNTKAGQDNGKSGAENQGSTSTADVTKGTSQNTAEATKEVSQNTKAKDYSDVQFTRLLKAGMEGEDVKKLQYLLKEKKVYNAGITGIYDLETQNAVKEFQRLKGLLQDGKAGSGTWDILMK